MTKVIKRSENFNNKFVDAIAKILPRNNGSQAGFNALAESLKRGEALLSQSTNVKEVAGV